MFVVPRANQGGGLVLFGRNQLRSQLKGLTRITLTLLSTKIKNMNGVLQDSMGNLTLIGELNLGTFFKI